MQRRQAERKWRETGLHVHRQIFVQQRNIVSNMIRQAKREYICQKIERAENSKELFRLSSQMTGKANVTLLPSNIPPQSLPDAFNDFFIGKIDELRNSFGSDTPTPVDTIEFSGTSLAEFQPVTEDYVKSILKKMPKKSCDLDPIPASVLFSCVDEITPLITTIMNRSLSSGVVPQCFKHAIVKPLLKKTNLDPDCLKHYRPISNLPFLSKLLERIVLAQLLQHLEFHNLLEPFQSAYRKCHSTETALLRVVNDLLQACDSGRVSMLSLLDLSAAFDTIDHGILIAQLRKNFGCSGKVLEWFKSYLACRTQSVLVGHESSQSVLKYGVPQGSVLGPVLFTIYMKPLSTVISQSGHLYHFFADDTQLHNSSVPSEFPTLALDLTDTVEDVANWMTKNKLKMNEQKTELINIGTKAKISQISTNSVTISGCKISFSPCVKNLGVYFDETLSMDAHIQHLCRSLYYQLRNIAKIRPSLTANAANKLAISFILSRLDYCNSLLAGLPDNKLNKLQRIQNHAARLVLRRPRHESAKSLLRTLHWLPVKARIHYKIACICFQCIFLNTMPTYLSGLLHPYCPSRNLRSLDSSLLTVPRFSLQNFGKRSFSVFGPTIWNSLPLSLRKTRCFSTLKNKQTNKHLKAYLFQTYLT